MVKNKPDSNADLIAHLEGHAEAKDSLEFIQKNAGAHIRSRSNKAFRKPTEAEGHLETLLSKLEDHHESLVEKQTKLAADDIKAHTKTRLEQEVKNLEKTIKRSAGEALGHAEDLTDHAKTVRDAADKFAETRREFIDGKLKGGAADKAIEGLETHTKSVDQVITRSEGVAQHAIERIKGVSPDTVEKVDLSVGKIGSAAEKTAEKGGFFSALHPGNAVANLKKKTFGKVAQVLLGAAMGGGLMISGFGNLSSKTDENGKEIPANRALAVMKIVGGAAGGLAVAGLGHGHAGKVR